jgi:hypothetical protein
MFKIKNKCSRSKLILTFPDKIKQVKKTVYIGNNHDISPTSLSLFTPHYTRSIKCPLKSNNSFISAFLTLVLTLHLIKNSSQNFLHQKTGWCTPACNFSSTSSLIEFLFASKTQSSDIYFVSHIKRHLITIFDYRKPTN